jgi:hypothetical protein
MIRPRALRNYNGYENEYGYKIAPPGAFADGYRHRAALSAFAHWDFAIPTGLASGRFRLVSELLLYSGAQGDTKAQVVVPVRRVVPVTARGPAIPGGVDPAPAPVHPVRAFRPPPPNGLTPFDGNSNWPVLPLE